MTVSYTHLLSGGFAPYFRYAVGPHLCRGLYKDRGYSGLWADDGWRSWETGSDPRQQLGRGFPQPPGEDCAGAFAAAGLEGSTEDIKPIVRNMG